MESVLCLTQGITSRKKTPLNGAQRKVKSADFFAQHPVFSLDEASRALSSKGGRVGTMERLRYHLDTGRIKLVTRGIYAAVPLGTSAEAFLPDPFLVGVTARPDAVFCHHSALELLGAAHSVWSELTMYTARRRRPITLGKLTLRFLQVPTNMDTQEKRSLGTRQVERLGRLLVSTGPERTLVEGFRHPRLVGGLEELVLSASGFPVLDLDLLEKVLRRYERANLWAATGWFLERFQRDFHVGDELLDRWSSYVPRSPQYLERGLRGGGLMRRWNLIIPTALEQLGGPDER